MTTDPASPPPGRWIREHEVLAVIREWNVAICDDVQHVFDSLRELPVLEVAEPPPRPVLIITADRIECPVCHAADRLVTLSPCEGIHHLYFEPPTGRDEPVLFASWSTHTDMTDEFPYCQDCGTELSWPDPRPEINWT